MPAATTRTLHFTKQAIERLPPPIGARVYLYDAQTRGLALCITPAGTKTFYLVRRVGPKVERIRLGAWPEMTVAQARDQADEHNGSIAKGENPAESRRDYRGAPTFKQIFDEFIALPTRTKAKRPKAWNTVHNYRLQFNAYLADWHERKLSAVTHQDIEKLHNQIAADTGPYAANRVLSLLKVLFNTAIDLRLFNGNPAAGIRPFEEHTRERFLQPDELPKFWQALEDEPSEKVRDFFKLALFTGQRRANVAAMRWADVNLDRGVWSLPHTKTGRHEVPLIPQAIEVLRRRQESRREGAEYVLPGRHGAGHLVDPMRAWKAILRRAGIENLRIHDLRRSLGSWMAIGGASLEVVGKTMGHSRPETTMVYARLHDDPVRRAMESAASAILATAVPAKSEEKKPKGGKSNGKAEAK